MTSSFSPFLYTGVTLARFQSHGNFPLLRDMLNRHERELEEYFEVRSLLTVCSTTRKQPCKGCCGLLHVANEVLQKGFFVLKSAFEMAYPDATYKSWHARRRMLQMPLALLGIGNRSRGSYSIFLVENQDRVKHSIMQTLLNQ